MNFGWWKVDIFENGCPGRRGVMGRHKDPCWVRSARSRHAPRGFCVLFRRRKRALSLRVAYPACVCSLVARGGGGAVTLLVFQTVRGSHFTRMGERNVAEHRRKRDSPSVLPTRILRFNPLSYMPL